MRNTLRLVTVTRTCGDIPETSGNLNQAMAFSLGSHGKCADYSRLAGRLEETGHGFFYKYRFKQNTARARDRLGQSRPEAHNDLDWGHDGASITQSASPIATKRTFG
jgi:hypothetical protein